MHILFQLLSSIVVTLVLYASYLLVNIIQFRINSQIKDVPGPPSKHWFWGNMKEIMDSVRAYLAYPHGYIAAKSLNVLQT